MMVIMPLGNSPSYPKLIALEGSLYVPPLATREEPTLRYDLIKLSFKYEKTD